MSLLVQDRALLERFRRGESSALTTVFRHYAPDLARLLRRGFGFEAGGRAVRFAGYDRVFDLEDSLQDIFRRAFSDHARQAYDGLRPYRTYLGAIARNAVIDDYLARKKLLQRYVHVEVDAAPEDDWSAAHDPFADEAPPIAHPERDMEAGELRALVASYKRDLADREQRVFAMRFDDGLSHTDIAARTGLSPSQIKTSEARIKRGLFRFLRRHGYLSTAETKTGVIRVKEGEET
jgi:RNA polymerase sigma-70 factor, ECF subfamily